MLTPQSARRFQVRRGRRPASTVPARSGTQACSTSSSPALRPKPGRSRARQRTVPALSCSGCPVSGSDRPKRQASGGARAVARRRTGRWSAISRARRRQPPTANVACDSQVKIRGTLSNQDRRVIARRAREVLRGAVKSAQTYPWPAAADAVRGTRPSQACRRSGTGRAYLMSRAIIITPKTARKQQQQQSGRRESNSRSQLGKLMFCR